MVKKVFTEEQKELRFESWIIVKLENGQEIELYHQGHHDFRKYIGKTLDCLIYPSSIKNINKPLDPRRLSLEGIYIGKYDIPSKFKRGNIESFSGRTDAVKTDIDIFIIGYKIAEDLGLKKGDKIKFNFTRYYLLDWVPIEE